MLKNRCFVSLVMFIILAIITIVSELPIETDTKSTHIDVRHAPIFIPQLTDIKTKILYTKVNASAYTCFSKRENRTKAHGYIKGTPYRRTASGTICKPWQSAAVDPRFIPFGTRIYNPEYKIWYIAEDTGNGIIGDMIDFAVGTDKTAMKFGRKTLQVTIIPKR